jgi:uncharacterized protein
MTKRLNITLSDDVLARADVFAKRERYTRSGLIAAALEVFVAGSAGGAGVARESTAAYAPEAVGLNPAIRPLVPAIIEICRRYGVSWAALVGSSTQPDPAVVPRDLDILVDLGPELDGLSRRYFGVIEDLEAVSGRHVDLIEREAVKNPNLRAEFARTQVVIYEAP